MTKLYLISPIVFCMSFVSIAQQRELKSTLDVLEYDLVIKISDQSDTLFFGETVKAVCVSDTSPVSLELTGQRQDGRGMIVHSVSSSGLILRFEQKSDRVIFSGMNPRIGDTIVVQLDYSGIPADGLVIGKNKYGDRTIFGDNWPNRAHHWFACNDHPSDKAKVHFNVVVPNGMKVIANGRLIKEEIFKDSAIFEYRTDYELPTKVIVIGVADFRVANFGPVNSTGIPVSAWVYPQDEQKGFYDLELAPDILAWFENKIAAYPFDKLANVQSTTRYGGMENASCIFYDEHAIDGNRSMENLIAHEIAHQWFGNSASEKDFSHLWLSEGFATYLTNVYLLESKGEEVFYRQMEKDKARIFDFAKTIALPVIDTISEDLNNLLNANAYQKGSWILHMLRMKLGDEIFWRSIRSYYRRYQFSNASSEALKMVFEEECTCELDQFFEQWLHFSTNPQLEVKIKKKRNSLRVSIVQMQQDLFDLQVELGIQLKDGQVITKTVHVRNRSNNAVFALDGKPVNVSIDPKRKVLMSVR
jgi:aminopeptidase N